MHGLQWCTIQYFNRIQIFILVLLSLQTTLWWSCRWSFKTENLFLPTSPSSTARSTAKNREYPLSCYTPSTRLACYTSGSNACRSCLLCHTLGRNACRICFLTFGKCKFLRCVQTDIGSCWSCDHNVQWIDSPDWKFSHYGIMSILELSYNECIIYYTLNSQWLRSNFQMSMCISVGWMLYFTWNIKIFPFIGHAIYILKTWLGSPRVNFWRLSFIKIQIFYDKI